MRIIEPNQYDYLEYAETRAKGVSSTIRPLPNFPVEEYVSRWEGPPSHILWTRDYDGDVIRGYSVPYETMDSREEGVAEYLGLTDAGLTYSSSPPGIRTLHSLWLNGRLIPWHPSPYRRVFSEPIETLLATPLFIRTLARLTHKFPNRFSALKRVVVFIGCEFTTVQDLIDYEALFGRDVSIRLVYYRAWIGIVSSITTDLVLQDYEAGMPIQGLSVKIARENQIVLKGARVQNVKMLTKERITDFSGQWVPTRNIGGIGENGGLFVSGYVADPAQRKTTQTDIVPAQQKRD